MNINPRARDFIFQFQDSCNCCWKRPTPTSTQVYVSKSGAVRRWDSSKVTDRDQAIRHAVENVQTILAAESESSGADPHELIALLAEEHGIDLRQATLLTLGMIQRITKVASDLFESPKTPSAPTVGDKGS